MYEWNQLAQDTVANSCEHGDVRSTCITGHQFVDYSICCEYCHKRPAPRILHSAVWHASFSWRHDSPVYADSDKVKDGGGTASHVHGDVEITHETGKPPSPVHLQQKQKTYFYLGFFFFFLQRRFASSHKLCSRTRSSAVWGGTRAFPITTKWYGQ